MIYDHAHERDSQVNNGDQDDSGDHLNPSASLLTVCKGKKPLTVSIIYIQV